MTQPRQFDSSEYGQTPVERVAQRDTTFTRVIAGWSGDLEALDNRFLVATQDALKGDVGEGFIRELGTLIHASASKAQETFRQYSHAGIATRDARTHAIQAESLKLYEKQALEPDSRIRLPAPVAPIYEPHAAFYDYLRATQFKNRCTKELKKPLGFQVSRYTECSTAVATRATAFIANEVCWQRIQDLMAMSPEDRHHEESQTGIRTRELTWGMSSDVRGLALDLIDKVPQKQWKLSTEKHTPKERQRTKRLLRLAAAALVPLVLVKPGIDQVSALWGPQPEASSPAQPGTSPEKSETGICLSEEANRLLQTDCNILPVVTEGASFAVIDSVNYVSRYKMNVADKDLLISEVKQGIIQKNKLSPDYTTAFNTALKDPILRYVNTGLKVPLRIYQNPYESEENGGYLASNNSMRLVFTTDEDRSTEPLFPTWGAIRSALDHESAHALFEKWYDNSKRDRVTRQNVQALTKVCVADLKDSLRMVATEDGTKMIEQLNHLSKLVEKNATLLHADSLHVLTAEIETMKKALSDGSGDAWAKSKISIDDYSMGCGVWEASINLRFALTDSDRDTLLYSYPKDYQNPTAKEQFGIDMRNIFDNLNEIQDATVFSTMEYTTEGTVAKGVDAKKQGHPDNLTERVASTVALIQTAPHEYAHYINNLDITRKKHAVNFIRTLFTQLKHENSRVADKTNFKYVLTLIS